MTAKLEVMQNAHGWFFVGVKTSDDEYTRVSPYFMSEGAAQRWLDEYLKQKQQDT